MFDQNQKFERILFKTLGRETQFSQTRLVAAGNLNQAIYLDTDQGEFLLKTNYDSRRDIFPKEAKGLQMLAKHSPLKIPEVYGAGHEEEINYLLMEWFAPARLSGNYWQELGAGVAQLHATTNNSFGLEEENYIASLAQPNTYCKSWPEFFIHQRLEPMAGKALYDGLIDQRFLEEIRLVYPLFDDIFPKEIPALLHGDIWSGNVMPSASGKPALIDPAVYYGHREVDLAFSKLFGGFEQEFYHAYHEAFPLEPGFEERVPIYNLYPLLVHLNLFGSSYLPPIQRTVKHLLSRLP
ncbi:fructosamine kinase family protein [Litoribacter ruber]|uniref:fructosamine kinase family protein n=1 Tax=Litoribacter ruber TaxID=702568 RepID=UPI001BDACDCB|nr:fructosamine kinase family protein [Litoribacter ruber]MBT0812796.1 fructosamine kinase family protein [Litoribacter ruber]